MIQTLLDIKRKELAARKRASGYENEEAAN
jgi:hypothetical protein